MSTVTFVDHESDDRDTPRWYDGKGIYLIVALFAVIMFL